MLALSIISDNMHIESREIPCFTDSHKWKISKFWWLYRQYRSWQQIRTQLCPCCTRFYLCTCAYNWIKSSHLYWSQTFTQKNKTISPTCMHRCVPECAWTCVTAFELLHIRVYMHLFVIPRCKSTGGYKNNTPLALDLLLFGYIIMAGYPMVFNRERVYVFRHWGGKKIFQGLHIVSNTPAVGTGFILPTFFVLFRKGGKKSWHPLREREQHPHLTYFGAAVN